MATAAVRQPLLGEDGRGYELARRLDASGAWRAWLGDSAYASFVQSLSSPAAWEAFMRSDDASAKSRSDIHLQFRARALLFDKACISLSAGGASSPFSFSNINPAYLQLHEDDVYFSLEDSPPTTALFRVAQTAAQGRTTPGSNYDRNSSSGNEMPETWYNQRAEKLKKGKPFGSPAWDREPPGRTPDGMSTYVKLVEMHKRKRRLLLEGPQSWENGGSRSSAEGDGCLLPEIMFPANCVPENALPPPPISQPKDRHVEVEACGVLDSLPNLVCQNPAMVERFGIRPEFVKVEFARTKYRGKYGSEGIERLTPDQASQLSQKAMARLLASIGLEGGTEGSLDVLSKFMAAHACKLGRTLKILSDSYRQECSSSELLKMFAQTAGLSFPQIAEYMRETSKVVPLPNLQPAREVQAHPNYIFQQQAGQIQRPIHAHLNANYTQNLAFQQQQLQQLRRRQQPLSRVSSAPMAEVKMENTMDSATSDTFSSLHKQPQQFRSQQMAGTPAPHVQPAAHQFRAMSTAAMQTASTRLHTQSSFGSRAAPVKVEGFEELMGDGEPAPQHRLTSPST
ncbi:transcription initiation factor TFIID subunit [Wolffia australiana]